MIAITSPATPQLASLLPRIVRPRRPRSPKAAPGAHHHHHSREKSDLIVDERTPLGHAPSLEIGCDGLSDALPTDAGNA